jgi:hypothetical protein
VTSNIVYGCPPAAEELIFTMRGMSTLTSPIVCVFKSWLEIDVLYIHIYDVYLNTYMCIENMHMYTHLHVNPNMCMHNTVLKLHNTLHDMLEMYEYTTVCTHTNVCVNTRKYVYLLTKKHSHARHMHDIIAGKVQQH